MQSVSDRTRLLNTYEAQQQVQQLFAHTSVIEDPVSLVHSWPLNRSKIARMASGLVGRS